jgi:hypothetical protein
MPALIQATHKYRRHRASGQAVVTLNGVDLYLGPYKSVASLREYDRLVAEWLIRGRKPPSEDASQLLVMEGIAAYWRHAKTYYRGQDGKPTSELTAIKCALRPVRRLYGDRPVVEFGPLALKAVRAQLAAAGLARTTINQHVGRIKRLFHWLVSEELAPAAAAQSLAAVDGLRAGKCDVRRNRSTTQPWRAESC